MDKFNHFLRKLRRSTPFKVTTVLLVPIALIANLSTIGANARVLLNSKRSCGTSKTGSLVIIEQNHNDSRRTSKPKQKTGSPVNKSSELDELVKREE